MNDDVSFLIHNQKQIIHDLSLLIKNKCLISLYFGADKTFLLTAILEVDEAKNALIFDYGFNETINKQLLKASDITFQTDFLGIKVSFKGTRLTKILYEDESAFSMPIPESIFWLQRREFFRVTSLRFTDCYCQLTLNNQESVKLKLFDMSLKGFSVLNTSTEISSLLSLGAKFEQCKLVLSETDEDTIAFKVRSKFIINPDKIAVLNTQKIGCLITRIAPAFQATVQRFINQQQREEIQKMRRHE